MPKFSKQPDTGAVDNDIYIYLQAVFMYGVAWTGGYQNSNEKVSKNSGVEALDLKMIWFGCFRCGKQ